ncbi:MAG: IclR family transcriptional regulator [Candidatus Binatia bacterium]
MLVKSLEKALRILLSFETNTQSQSILEISKHTSMPVTSLYRFLKTFEKYGFIKSDPEGKLYQLGPSLFRLGMLSHNSVDLREAAKPEMERVAETLGESIFLTVRHDDNSVCIESVEGKHRVRLTQRIGAVLPLHAGAAAKVLLAYMPEPERQNSIRSLDLCALGPRTITRKVVLEKRILLVRSRGFDVSKEEVDPGACGVAVPVFSEKGDVVAALASGGPIYRFGDKKIRQLVDQLSKASKTIGRKLDLTGRYL